FSDPPSPLPPFSVPSSTPSSASGPTCSIRCSSSCPVESIDFGGARKSDETDRPHGPENNRSKKPPQTFEPPTPSVKVGSRQRASIPRPAVYETAALPGLAMAAFARPPSQR